MGDWREVFVVDSLCICQDDASTKHGQISAMNSIYADATLTLVALEGDASYGLPGVEPYASPRHQQVETVHGIRIMTLMPDINESNVAQLGEAVPGLTKRSSSLANCSFSWSTKFTFDAKQQHTVKIATES